MNSQISKSDLKKISEFIYEVPKTFRSDMKVPARIFISDKMIDELFKDRTLWQLINVSTLPGIQKHALVMPDAHEGYGFPIGGVAGISIEDGVISPGGIGYDINCGVRLLKSKVKWQDIKEYLLNLATQIQRDVPSGLGKGHREKLSKSELDKILKNGAKEIVGRGYGSKEDLEYLEANGCLEMAEPSLVSEHAKSRGYDQVGTIGSGNHFLEIQRVDKIFYPEAAKIFGLEKDRVVVLIHTGSRGLGHQIATDYIRIMMRAMLKYGIKLPDRELACAPFRSEEGQNYLRAMACGANFAWANRQMITYLVRKAWQRILGDEYGALDIVYDVAHNIAKIETYEVNGKKMKLCIHRKGATRAFGSKNPEIPQKYQEIGQPVLIPGSMGTASFVLVGTKEAEKISFSTTCHGAGRRMSRHQAKRQWRGSELKQQLEKQGIVVRAGSMSGLAEEAPLAYKDVEAVVDVVDGVGIAKKVARLKPLAVIKG